MHLADLEPSFLTVVEPGKRYQHHDDMAAAQGVCFLCPACFRANGGAEGTHAVFVWFRDRGVPEDEVPVPRWEVTGTGYADLTLSPSIHITRGCGWHGFVRGGAIT